MIKTSITIKDLPVEVEQLKTEMGRLRSLLIGLAWKDEEGEYNPRFVKEVLEAAREPSIYEFKNKETFLSQVEN